MTDELKKLQKEARKRAYDLGPEGRDELTDELAAYHADCKLAHMNPSTAVEAYAAWACALDLETDALYCADEE